MFGGLISVCHFLSMFYIALSYLLNKRSLFLCLEDTTLMDSVCRLDISHICSMLHVLLMLLLFHSQLNCFVVSIKFHAMLLGLRGVDPAAMQRYLAANGYTFPVSTNHEGMAAALSALLLVAISVLYTVYNRLVGKTTFAAKSR